MKMPSFGPTLEQQALEHYQIKEKDGEIWITYDNVPIVPESMLNLTAIEALKQLRKLYINGKET